MSVVKCYNKKVGVTYVYNSETYWDPERKHSRAKRELIGILDEKIGEIIPTRKKGDICKQASQNKELSDAEQNCASNSYDELSNAYLKLKSEYERSLDDKAELISELKKLSGAIDSIQKELKYTGSLIRFRYVIRKDEVVSNTIKTFICWLL